MVKKIDSLNLSQLADVDIEMLEWARKTISKELDRRQGGELKKLQKQFAKLAGVMGFAQVSPDSDSKSPVRRRGRSQRAGRTEEEQKQA